MRISRAALAGAMFGVATIGFTQGPISLVNHASGFSQPLAYIQDPLDPGTRFAVQKSGVIQRVVNGVTRNVFMDISTSISFTTGNERGLLGLAFAPNHASTGHFYAYFTDTGGDIQVARYTRSGNTANPATRLNVINIEHSSQTNHNGATPVFGPDGYLYLGIGDGGGSNDPSNNAQNPNSLLGKMLRIDPSVDDFAADPNKNYGIPASNPFAGTNGVIQAEDEIWAFGVRNPYKFSFDRANGALVIGDVGQGAWEEIDYQPAGIGARNYGWRQREGAHNTGLGGSVAFTPVTDPIFEYSHNSADPINGRSITGGVVYRGSRLVGFQGRYIFADFIVGRVWSLGLNIDPITGQASAGNLLEHTAAFGGSSFLGNISSLDQDLNGELFLTSFNGNIYSVVPEPGTIAALGIGVLALLRRRKSKG